MSFALVRPANESIVAVCTKMAAKDLTRARRISEMITPGEIEKKPFSLGLMAQALAASDKSAALHLLDEAFTELERLRARGRTSQFASISGVAGGLLPVVEQVDPSRLAEFLARALALRPPQGGLSERTFLPEQPAMLAIMVARYDRRLAAQVIQPDLENLGKPLLSYGGVDLRTRRTLCAEVVIDPHKAIDQIESLPDRPNTLYGSAITRNEILIDAAKLLSLHRDDRWRHVYERYLLLWTPDQEVR
jgi:hypothetical protein